MIHCSLWVPQIFAIRENGLYEKLMFRFIVKIVKTLWSHLIQAKQQVC